MRIYIYRLQQYTLICTYIIYIYVYAYNIHIYIYIHGCSVCCGVPEGYLAGLHVFLIGPRSGPLCAADQDWIYKNSDLGKLGAVSHEPRHEALNS